ncbi:hypothetical protein JCM5350_004449 [Sporobolomyces pararoseus]
MDRQPVAGTSQTRSDPSSSINTSLPPPRFNPGSDSTIRETLQNDPVLKLIPMKRARSREKSRAYRIADGPVTENWESEFEVWAQQEIDILAEVDKGLAATESSRVFGIEMEPSVKTARQLLKLKHDANDFRKAKELVARTLNRRRLLHDLQAPLIPMDETFQRPETRQPQPPPPPPPPPSDFETQRSLSEPRDVKPEIPQNDDEGQGQGGGTGGSHARARTHDEQPQVSNQSTSAPPDPVLTLDEPQPKQYKLRGMDQPFPPYLVEVYLHTRQQVPNPAQGSLMIKTLFADWTRSVGDTTASRYIFDLERLAADEAESGGLPEAEATRRALCSRIFCNERLSKRSAERSNSRQSSPVASVPPPPPPQQFSAPPSPTPPQSDASRVCKKCKSESLTCDGEDPCSECIKRGRYHLCTFPEEAPAPLPTLPALPPIPSPSPAVVSQAPVAVSTSPQLARSFFPPAASSQQGPPTISPLPVHSPTLLSQMRETRDGNDNRKSGRGTSNSNSSASIQSSAPAPHFRNRTHPSQGHQTVSLEQARAWARETQARHQQQLDSHGIAPRRQIIVPQPTLTTPPLQQTAFPPRPPQTSPPMQVAGPQQIPTSQQNRRLTQDSGPPPSQSPQASPNLQSSQRWSPYAVPPTSSAPPPGPHLMTPPLTRVGLSPADQAPPPRSRNNSEPSSHLQRSHPLLPSEQSQQQQSQRRQNQDQTSSTPVGRFQSPAWQNFVRGLPPVVDTLQKLSSFFSTLRPPPGSINSAPLSRSTSLNGK